MKRSARATSDETLEALLARAKHDHAPLRHSFLQRDTDGGSAPLSAFVSAGRSVTLDLYLSILFTASVGNHHVQHPAAVWGRALDLPGTANSAARVSRDLHWLAEHRLIDLVEGTRPTEVVLLREDGAGGTYHQPGRKKPGADSAEGRYIRVPDAYWLDRWHARLTLPAKAALLIAMSLSDDFYLHQERAPRYYGISADSMGRGLRLLRDEGLLKAREVTKSAPLLASGITTELHYTLQPPFGPKGRRAPRKAQT